jgi:hypothetical protein
MHNHDNIIKKLEKLYWKVHGLPADNDGKGNKDLLWVRRILEDVRDSGLVPDKTEFKMANLMWKKHTGGVSKDDDVMWSLIDMLLTQERPSKIQAIKMYRKFVDITLRGAKEAVDAREYGLKNGWDV